jgi:hypothetical protein
MRCTPVLLFNVIAVFVASVMAITRIAARPVTQWSAATKEDFMGIQSIKDEMAKSGGIDPADLEYITIELMEEMERSAIPVEDDSEMSLLATWSGNSLIVNGRTWTWKDTPGSQCGQTRTWRYTAQAGASYRQAGRCPQGYAWYSMEIPRA